MEDRFRVKVGLSSPVLIKVVQTDHWIAPEIVETEWEFSVHSLQEGRFPEVIS